MLLTVQFITTWIRFGTLTAQCRWTKGLKVNAPKISPLLGANALRTSVLVAYLLVRCLPVLYTWCYDTRVMGPTTCREWSILFYSIYPTLLVRKSPFPHSKAKYGPLGYGKVMFVQNDWPNNRKCNILMTTAVRHKERKKCFKFSAWQRWKFRCFLLDN